MTFSCNYGKTINKCRFNLFSPTMHIIIQTPRLIIREFLSEELDTYLHHFNDEAVCLYIPKRTREERIGIFGRAIEGYAVTKQSGIWGMFTKVNDEFIGSCLLRVYDNDAEKMEIGYSIDKKYWGQGLGTEMTEAMIEYCFTNKGVIEIVGLTTLENIGSHRVLEKAGLQRQEDINRDGEELALFKVVRP
jgi:ribosomal-protein-alanine N-acetyltransferase